MKNLISIIVLTLILSCCSKKDEESNPASQLPPVTTTGANTAGCLVNGVVLLPKGGGISSGPTLSCFYQQDQGGYHLGLSIVDKGSNEDKLVVISLNPNQLVENKTYILVAKVYDSNNDNISNFGEFRINNNINSGNLFRTRNSLPGELKITKLNTQQRIISGTFWYDAYDVNSNKVEVREGRFDMHYVN